MLALKQYICYMYMQHHETHRQPQPWQTFIQLFLSCACRQCTVHSQVLLHGSMEWTAPKLLPSHATNHDKPTSEVGRRFLDPFCSSPAQRKYPYSILDDHGKLSATLRWLQLWHSERFCHCVPTAPVIVGDRILSLHLRVYPVPETPVWHLLSGVYDFGVGDPVWCLWLWGGGSCLVFMTLGWGILSGVKDSGTQRCHLGFDLNVVAETGTRNASFTGTTWSIHPTAAVVTGPRLHGSAKPNRQQYKHDICTAVQNITVGSKPSQPYTTWSTHTEDKKRTHIKKKNPHMDYMCRCNSPFFRWGQNHI